MERNEFEFKKFKSKGSFLPFLIAALIVLLLAFLLRNCNSPNEFWNGTPPGYVKKNPTFPDKPNVLQPIDTTKITIPEGPLKRKVVSNLLNIYLQDTTNLKSFSEKVINTYKSDSLKVVYYADAYKRIQLQVPEQKNKSLKDSLKKAFKAIKFVCDESVFSSNKVKNDPGFNNLNYSWFYEKIGLYKAWDETQGDSSIKVAVIDDSFDVNHKELINQIEEPWNVFDYSDKITTYNNKLFHGTHVAGTAVGEIGNGVGISGVAPLCKLIPIQIADKNGIMTTSSILDGIFYALKNDADVINMSLGINFPSSVGKLTEKQQEIYANTIYKDEAAMWNEVYEIAKKEGTVIVQAAGNSSVISKLDPMKRSEISIVVGATDKNNNRASFSNYGSGVDVYAPGVKIYSSFPNQKFKFLDGTSMASPIVSGCVALIKSKNKNISVDEIKKLMLDTGLPFNGTKDRLIQIDQLLLKINKL